MAKEFTITGQDPATEVVEDLGTTYSHHRAATEAETVAEKMAERMIDRGMEGVNWKNADGGWRYEVWSNDGLAYVVRVEEVDGDE